MYITPGRYRTMGYGADIEDVDDSQLAAQLRLASSLINRYCNRPMEYDFRGGVITDEKHAWKLGNQHVPVNQISLFPKFKPLVELDDFKIYVTNTQYLNVDTNLITYGPGNALTPVIAASSIGIWSYTAVPIAGFPVPEARISYSYGYSHTDTNEILYPEGGGVMRSANCWWSSDPVEVYKNGTLLTLNTDYTINANEGFIDLSQDQQDALDFDDIITATYTHFVPEDVRDATAVVLTDLLGAKQIVAAGLQGLTEIKAEEIELRQDPKSSTATGEISDRAKMLLEAYREYHWG